MTNNNKEFKNINQIDFSTINKAINSCKTVLVEEYFNEYHLFLLSNYFLTRSDQIYTTTGKSLRSTTEPDIWEAAYNDEKFFCVTSLFRKEEINSLLHKEEFKIIDFYVNNSNINELFRICKEMMQSLEKKFSFPSLSEFEFIEVDFNEYKNLKLNIYNGRIINVINYPVEESFFDEINPLTNKTYKGELFYVDNGNLIEFGVYGKVGENRNPTNEIKDFLYTKQSVNFKNLFGMCFGIERILFVYKKLISH